MRTERSERHDDDRHGRRRHRGRGGNCRHRGHDDHRQPHHYQHQ